MLLYQLTKLNSDTTGYNTVFLYLIGLYLVGLYMIGKSLFRSEKVRIFCSTQTYTR